MESAWSIGNAAYQCRHGRTGATAPGLSRPKNTCVREDKLLPHVTGLHRLVTSPATRYSVVRVKDSAGPVRGELEVTSSVPQGSLASTAIAILILVTAAVVAAVALGAAGWVGGFPAVATGLGACGAFAVVFGVGVYIACRRPGRRPAVRDQADRVPRSVRGGSASG